MPYFALLLLTAMGLMLNKVWEGAILGIVVWWLGRKISSPPQDIQQQQLESMQDELAHCVLQSFGMRSNLGHVQSRFHGAHPAIDVGSNGFRDDISLRCLHN